MLFIRCREQTKKCTQVFPIWVLMGKEWVTIMLILEKLFFLTEMALFFGTKIPALAITTQI